MAEPPKLSVLDDLVSRLKDMMLSDPGHPMDPKAKRLEGADPMQMATNASVLSLEPTVAKLAAPKVVGITASHPDAGKLVGGIYKAADGSAQQILDKIPKTDTWLVRNAESGKLSLHKDPIDPSAVSGASPFDLLGGIFK